MLVWSAADKVKSDLADVQRDAALGDAALCAVGNSDLDWLNSKVLQMCGGLLICCRSVSNTNVAF